MENKTILITGAAGYIGGTFAYEALKRGCKVIGLDNFSNSKNTYINYMKQNFADKFIFLEKDLRDNNLYELKELQKDIDCVFHFAALKSVPDSEKNPKLYFENNVEGTENLIKLMSLLSIKKLIFSSSAAVYGDQKTQPIKETAILSPKSVYAKTKKMSEDLIDKAVKESGLSAISLRYFNPLGSHRDKIVSDNFQNTSGNIMAMILRVKLGMNEKLFIYGDDYPTKDGTGERDFIHITDLIEGHFKAYEKLHDNTGHIVFNLGTGTSISVSKLVRTFEQINNSKIAFEIIGRRKGDLARCYADSSKANRELNWKAVYTLENMCKDAWEAVKNGVN